MQCPCLYFLPEAVAQAKIILYVVLEDDNHCVVKG